MWTVDVKWVSERESQVWMQPTCFAFSLTHSDGEDVCSVSRAVCVALYEVTVQPCLVSCV